MGVNKREDAERKGTSRQKTLQETYDAPFVGFINVNLTDAEKGSFVRWAETASWAEVLALAVSDGVMISVKHDPKGDGFLASATHKRTTSPNAGYVVTARSNEPVKALLRLLFILAGLMKKERWVDVHPAADPDRW